MMVKDFSIGTFEALFLGSSVALSGVFYYFYRKKTKTLKRLNDAPHIGLNDNLVDILDTAPGKCLQYAIIKGTVQPVGEPLRSQFREGSVGVIQKLVLREHKVVWNSLAHTWTDREQLLHERLNLVPFNLVGEDGTCLQVLRPLEAAGPNMEMVHEKFHQASYGFSDLVSQYLSGEKSKGQLETEEMLKVGVSITAAGELILDSDRLIKLRPPTDGSTYFLSTSDFESLRHDQEGQADGWWMLTAACALVGAGVVLWIGLRFYQQRRRRQEREIIQRLPEQTGEGEEGIMNPCVICLTHPRECVLLDCGHVCCCYSCYEVLPQPRCPMCRQSIRRVVPLYQV